MMNENPINSFESDDSKQAGDTNTMKFALDWLQQAVLLNKKVALQLAVLLLRQQQKYPDHNLLRIFPKLLRRYGIPRSSAYMALKSLEEADLIQVSRNHGESPLVEIRW